MDAATLASRHVVTTPAGRVPPAFERAGQPVTDAEFVRACWAEELDPYAVAKLCERRVPAHPHPAATHRRPT